MGEEVVEVQRLVHTARPPRPLTRRDAADLDEDLPERAAPEALPSPRDHDHDVGGRIHGERDLGRLAPRRRRLGVASALMKRAIDETRISEGTSITLEVRAGNSAAIGLYQALGFERDGLRRDLYPDGEDGVLMRLHL